MLNFIFDGHVDGMNVEEKQAQEEYSMVHHHIHEYTELYFLLEGERYYFIDQNIYHVKAGMAVLIHPEQLHKTSKVNGQSGHRRFLLELDSEFLSSFFLMSDLKNTMDFQEHFSGVTVFSKEDWAQVLLTIDMLKMEMAKKGEMSKSICKSLVTCLLLLYVRNHKSNDSKVRETKVAPNHIHENTHQLVQGVLLYLQEHFTENYSLEEIANDFHISKSSLTTNFKSITGFTINEYVRICRVRKAKTLLLKSNLSITEIASQTGFGNVTYFERVFKKFYEMSPLQFRKQDYLLD